MSLPPRCLSVLIPTFNRSSISRITYNLSKSHCLEHIYLIGSNRPYQWCAEYKGVIAEHLPGEKIHNRISHGANIATSEAVLMMSDDDILVADSRCLASKAKNTLLLPRTYYVRAKTRLGRCGNQVIFSALMLFAQDWLAPALCSNLVIWSSVFKRDEISTIALLPGSAVSSHLVEKLMIVYGYSRGYDLNISPDLILVRNKMLISYAQGVRMRNAFDHIALAGEISEFFEDAAASCRIKARKSSILKLKTKFISITLESKGDVATLNNLLLNRFCLPLSLHLSRLSTFLPRRLPPNVGTYLSSSLKFKEDQP